MPIKYKLVRKRNPRDPQSPQKWYAVPNSEAALDTKAMTRAATKNTTTAPIELESSLELLADFVPEQLLQGHTVKLTGLGRLRLTFKSDGADTVADFKPGEMIHNLRIVFTPDDDLRQRILKDAAFEDGGVKDGSVSYATRADYYEATGQAPEPQPGTGTGGGSGTGGSDDGEGTLG